MKITYALISLASVAASSFTGGGFGTPGIDVDDKVWEQAMMKPNGTGRANLAGYDITKPYPGTPMDGWSMNVSVASDMDAANNRLDSPPNGTVFTGIQYDWNLPPSLQGKNVTAHPSWIVTQSFIMANGNWVHLKKGAKIDTDCKGWINDDCRDSILQSGESVGYGFSYPEVSFDNKACDSLRASMAGAASYHHHQAISSNVFGRLRTGSAASQPGNNTGYNSAINRVQIVVTQFSRNGTVMPDRPKGLGEQDVPKPVLTCMFVQDIAEGSSSAGHHAAAIGVQVWFALAASLIYTILI